MHNYAKLIIMLGVPNVMEKISRHARSIIIFLSSTKAGKCVIQLPVQPVFYSKYYSKCSFSFNH